LDGTEVANMNANCIKLPVACVLLAGSIHLSVAAECSLGALNWMAGLWQNAADPHRAEERWAVAPAGVLMGSAWEFPEGKQGYAEIMTIRMDGSDVVMVLRHFDGGLKRAWEERDAPVIFKASVCDRESAVFDGQGDHAGEHLSYKRSAEKLLIVGDFLHHGTPDHEEWHMIKSAH
jgi:hypothetical protein